MINRIITSLKSVKPSCFFLLVGLIAGIIFIIITPPFQVPDEINHFYRSYQISEGFLIAGRYENRLGGDIPVNVVSITKPFLPLKGNTNAKSSWKTIHEQFSIPMHQKEKIFVDFPNTALYTPISYIPQSFGVFIFRKCNFSPMIIFYGARFFTLLVWIFFIWIAIRIVPVYKWLFTLLALLPMSIYTNMSLSADVVTNICAFLLITYILKVVFQDSKFSLHNFLIVALLAVILASAKLVYTPLIILFTLIPVKKFKGYSYFTLYFILLLIIGFGTAYLWTITINNLYIPYSEYNPLFRNGLDLIDCSNMHEQMVYIKHHGLYILEYSIKQSVIPLKCIIADILAHLAGLTQNYLTGLFIFHIS